VKTIRLALFSVPLLLSLCACSSAPPRPQELSSANYGPYPQDYQQRIAAFMQANLRDPGSAMYTAPKPPVKAYAGMRNYTYGWATCMSVNAKNGFGGYTGANLYYFLFRDGSVALFERAGAGSSPFELDYVHDLCARLN
jgi:hypothetical protein